MLGAGLIAVGALALARALYPLAIERRALRRRPVGPDGIIPGAAAITKPGARAAVLLLHGGGDTPQVLADLADHLHDAGFAVSVPLLGAHGRSLPEFARAASAQWHAEVEREFDRLHARHGSVFVVGISMGGALALTLAVRRSGIPALVLLAPYIDMPTVVRALARTTSFWGWLLPYLPSLGSRSIRDPAAAARGLGHGIVTPASLRALYEVMDAAAAALPRVTAPTLVVQSREDNRITVQSAERAFERLGSPEKRFVWVEGAGHVITVDYGRERVFDLVREWLESHQRAGRPDESGASAANRSVR